jgi:thiamine pyrophosphate-dependent acetolactate synthase large subunit-like protein
MIPNSVGFKVQTEEELEHNLSLAINDKTPGRIYVIEVIVDKKDISPALKRATKVDD